MRPLVICCSQRRKPEMDKFIPFLQSKGVLVLYPNFRRHRQEMIKKDEHVRLESPDYKLKIPGLVRQHLDMLRNAETLGAICLIFNPMTKGGTKKKHGYIGKNTTLEMGFSARGGLPMIMIKPDNDDSTMTVAHSEDKKRIFTFAFPDKDPLDYEFMWEYWLKPWLDNSPPATSSQAGQQQDLIKALQFQIQTLTAQLQAATKSSPK